LTQPKPNGDLPEHVPGLTVLVYLIMADELIVGWIAVLGIAVKVAWGRLRNSKAAVWPLLFGK
jgi:hypothetical protein